MLPRATPQLNDVRVAKEVVEKGIDAIPVGGPAEVEQYNAYVLALVHAEISKTTLAL
jgi:heptaprenylglyceryl phosphate synthase